MKTPLETAELIQTAIGALGKEGERSLDLIQSKAKAVSEYDRVMGLATANLKAEGMAATLIDKIAKERCHKALYDKIVAEETLKAHYCRLSTLESQLNGLQSMNRYLQSTSRSENL